MNIAIRTARAMMALKSWGQDGAKSPMVVCTGDLSTSVVTEMLRERLPPGEKVQIADLAGFGNNCEPGAAAVVLIANHDFDWRDIPALPVPTVIITSAALPRIYHL